MSCPLINPFSNFHGFNKINKFIPFIKAKLFLTSSITLIHHKQKLYYRSCGGTYG